MADFLFSPATPGASMDDHHAAPQYAVRIHTFRVCDHVTVDSLAFAYRRIASVRKSVANNARWSHTRLIRDVADITRTRVRAQTKDTWHKSLIVAATWYTEGGVKYGRTIEVVAL